MVVFISSPFGGDPDKNTIKARQYCRFAVEKGVTPYAPHLLFPQFMSDETERNVAIKMGLDMLSRCDEVWCFGGMSPGMKIEIGEAKRLHKPVRYFIPAGSTFSLMRTVQQKGGPYEGILR